MHLKRHLATITAAGGLAIAGLATAAPTHVFAGASGSPSSDCAGDPNASASQVLLSAPVYLAVAVRSQVLSGSGNFVAVCYSDTPAGQNSNLAGGVAGVFYPVPEPYGDTWCASDPSSFLQLACGVGVWPTYSLNGTVLTVSIPFGVCIDTNVSGGACTTPQPGPSLAATGLVVGTYSVTPPPAGYAVGAGIQLTGFQLLIDGVPVPLTNSSAAAGANPSTVGYGTVTGGIPLCAPVVGCTSIPGSWVGTTSTVPAAQFVVNNTPLTVTVPTECLSAGTTCPTPY